MKMSKYKPEGFSRGFSKNKKYTYTLAELKNAMETGLILEARAIKCTSELNLVVYLGNNIVGTIPYEEAEMTLDNSATKSIAVMTRAGRIVCFKVKAIDIDESNNKINVTLSRKEAQEQCQKEFINKLEFGEIIDAKVNHIEQYGLFCDIGCGISALLSLDNMCITRISDPKTHLENIKYLKVIVKGRDSYGRLILSHKELLGTWEEEASKFHTGDTVVGTVRSVESYGVFVELTPNLSGLAELTEDVTPGQSVTVFIKNIIPDKMKIKLIIISSNGLDKKVVTHYNYTKTEGRIDRWRYSPEGSTKVIETIFNAPSINTETLEAEHKAVDNEVKTGVTANTDTESVNTEN